MRSRDVGACPMSHVGKRENLVRHVGMVLLELHKRGGVAC
jgi:hypothetical protein